MCQGRHRQSGLARVAYIAARSSKLPPRRQAFSLISRLVKTRINGAVNSQISLPARQKTSFWPDLFRFFRIFRNFT